MFNRILTLAVALGLTLAAPARACETALLLAMDVSSSVDPGEYRLQVDGLADALIDPEIAIALEQGQVHLAVMQWSSVGEQDVSLNWTAMRNFQDIRAFSDAARNIKRAYVNSTTAPGDALSKGIEMMAEVDHCQRKIIDVSGDGSSNSGEDPRISARRAHNQGIIVNGIAIESLGVSITQYYRKFIITPHGFVITARRHIDYPRAIAEKIKRELSKVTG